MNSTFVTGVTTSLQVSDNSLMMLGSQAGWTTGTSKTDWLAKRHTSKKSCVIPLLAQQASFPIVYYHPLAFLQKRAATNKKVFDVSYDGSVAFVIVLLWQSYFRLFPFRLWYMGGGRGEDMREVSDAIKVPLERPKTFLVAYGVRLQYPLTEYNFRRKVISFIKSISLVFDCCAILKRKSRLIF